MAFYADLHVHSKYSRATSRDCDLEHLAWWARRKGIAVVATGDFTHPAWFDELRDKLVPAEPGLFRLRPDLEREVERNLPPPCRGAARFLLEVEISTIYKKGDKTRKVHHLVYAGSFDTAARFRERLAAIGNVASDGRPILGLDSRHLLEIALESGDDAYLVPAHIWTPWFSVLGSKSGFDSVAECYGDLAGHIFAVETGLSSDPPMNWRVSGLDRYTLVSNSDAHSPPMLGREACAFDCALDYFAIRRALASGEGYRGTVEFFPEEGKYHLDGHRGCGVRLSPRETRQRQGLCPECGKPVTVGVMHRVEVLADRPAGSRPEAAGFRSLVPLPEIVAEIAGVGPRTKTVERAVGGLVSQLGPELAILEHLPLEEVAGAGEPLLAEALSRLRAGRVRCEAGYDGEYGVIRLFEPGEIEARRAAASLFGAAPGGGKGERRGTPSTGERRRAGAAAATTPAPVPAPAAAGEQPPPPAPEPAAGAAAAVPRPAPGSLQLALVIGSVLDGLDPEQRSAAEHLGGPLLIVAGPGTGKTRTLTHRLAHLVAEVGVPPEHCLAVTFTRRAAAEMAERLAGLIPAAAGRLTVDTFHGLGLSILRRQAAEVGLPPDFRVADEGSCLALARDLFDLSAAAARRLLADFGRLRRERAALAWGSGAGGAAAEPIAGAAAAAGTGERLAAYETALAGRGEVDFDQLLALPSALLDRRPELLDGYRRRWRRIAVDEYQDVDALGYGLLRRLAPAGADLCAIGDPDQAIYRFRGADVAFFLRFREDYPGARVVHLHRNYRSSPTIVAAALGAIRRRSLVDGGRRLEAVSAEAAERIVVHRAASARAEAEFVARSIEELLGGTSYYSLDSGRVGADDGRDLAFGDFAVLYRTRAQAAPLAAALAAAGIPFQERSHQPLAERPGVAALLELVRREPAAAGRRSAEARLRAAAERAGGPGGGGPVAEIAAAAELLAPLAAGHGDDLEGLLAAVALGAEVDAWDPRAERVSLLTLHAAKGLEFRVVFLVGLEDGLLPWRGTANEDADVDEERRLFFVGLTRARALLFLSSARRRRVAGGLRDREPSPFLADIEAALLERRRTAADERPRSRQLRLL